MSNIHIHTYTYIQTMSNKHIHTYIVVLYNIVDIFFEGKYIRMLRIILNSSGKGYPITIHKEIHVKNIPNICPSIRQQRLRCSGA